MRHVRMIVWEGRGTLRTVTENADGTYDAAFRDLTYVYLEDSWILEATPTEYALRFVIEAVLTPEHAEYHPAKPGEQHCYRAGILMISSTQPILFEGSEAPPAIDASGELDYGNIDTFTGIDWDGTAALELTGDWGRAIVKQPTVVLTLNQ